MPWNPFEDGQATPLTPLGQSAATETVQPPAPPDPEKPWLNEATFLGKTSDLNPNLTLDDLHKKAYDVSPERQDLIGTRARYEATRAALDKYGIDPSEAHQSGEDVKNFLLGPDYFKVDSTARLPDAGPKDFGELLTGPHQETPEESAARQAASKQYRQLNINNATPEEKRLYDDAFDEEYRKRADRAAHYASVREKSRVERDADIAHQLEAEEAKGTALADKRNDFNTTGEGSPVASSVPIVGGYFKDPITVQKSNAELAGDAAKDMVGLSPAARAAYLDAMIPKWKALGQVGFGEGLKENVDWSKVPFIGGFLGSEAETRDAFEKLQKESDHRRNGFSRMDDDEYQDLDKKVLAYVLTQEIQHARGKTFAGKIGSGVPELAKNIIEWMATDGIAAAAGKGAEAIAGGGKLLEEGGALAKGMSRADVLESANTVRAQVNALGAQGFKNLTKGAARVPSQADTLYKDTQDSITADGRGGAQAVQGKGLFDAVMGQVVSNTAFESMGGLSQIVGEFKAGHVASGMSANYLGQMARAAFGVDETNAPQGDDSTIAGRLRNIIGRAAAAMPNGEQVLVDAIMFSVPGVAHSSMAKALDAFRANPDLIKKDTRGGGKFFLSREGAAQLGITEQTSGKQRAEIAAALVATEKFDPALVDRVVQQRDAYGRPNAEEVTAGVAGQPDTGDWKAGEPKEQAAIPGTPGTGEAESEAPRPAAPAEEPAPMPESASSLVTSDMRQKLNDLGFSKDAVDGMKPAEAWDHIEKANSTPEAQIRARAAEQAPEASASEPARELPPFPPQEEIESEKLRQQGMAQKDLDAAKAAGLFALDNTTGLQEGRTGPYRERTFARAQAYAEQHGAPATYSEIDLRNLGGLNAKLGHTGANAVFRRIASMVRDHLLNAGVKFQMFRHGGDEMSVISVGHDVSSLKHLLAQAQEKVDIYIKQEGLDKIPHPKGGPPGTGFYHNTAQIVPRTPMHDIVKEADKPLEELKKRAKEEYERVNSGSPGQAGTASPDRQARGIKRGASGRNQEGRGRVRAVQSGVEQPREGVHGSAGERPATPAEAGPLAPAAGAPARSEPETPASAERVKQSLNLAGWVSEQLKSGQPFTWQALFKAADEHFGGTQAKGTYTSQDAYEAMQVGFNKLLEEKGITPTGNAAEIAKKLKLVEDLLNLLPTQTARTDEQKSHQQFSTPPTLALLANWVANIRKGETYLEPSAGTASLAVFGKLAGADVHANELSARRAALTEAQGIPTTNENADHLHALLNGKLHPSVVVMNPPFSQTAGRMGLKREPMVAANHISEALKLLQPGGRLVAIVGRGMSMDAATFKSWWGETQDHYNVRANVPIGGDAYKKYGTNFGTRILVIDKPLGGEGTSEKIAISPEIEQNDLGEVAKLLEGVHDDRVSGTSREDQGTQQPPLGQAGAGAAQGSGRRSSRRQPGPDRSGAVGDGEQRADVQSDDALRPSGTGDGAAVPDREGKPGTSTPGSVLRESGRPARPEGDEAKSGRAGTGIDNRESDAVGVEQAKKQAIVDEGEAYAKYRPSLKVENATAHPIDLVESQAMASVDAPRVTYKPAIPAEVLKSGKVSDAQAEQIVRAGAAHEQILPNGQRQGYMIGDGTGVGKSRELAGIIQDNWNRGRKKAIWVTKNDKLYKAIASELQTLGFDPKNVKNLGKWKLNDAIELPEGVIVTTYSTLASKSSVGAHGELTGRLKQLVNWAGGKDFDGVIAFDEAHEMGNALDTKGPRGTEKASGKALSGVEFQTQLPKARVVYASATGATEVSNLSYAQRLGLWGTGTGFPNVKDFISSVSSSGLATMEMIARDLKSMGLYLARQISLRGVGFEKMVHEISPQQHATYDRSAEAWRSLLNDVVTTLERTGGMKNKEARQVFAIYWAAQQRFFNGVLLGMQMPTVLKAIEKDLKEGKASVVQLVNTNEAMLEKELEKLKLEGGDEPDLGNVDVSPKGAMLSMVEKYFPTQLYEKYTDENGNEKSRPVYDSSGKPVLDPKAIQRKAEILTELGTLPVPQGALDQIVNHFGPQIVAEVTGRKRRVYFDQAQGKNVEESRGPQRGLVEAKEFQEGLRKILVFSEAGGTGASYHASNEVNNTGLRRHYVVQPGWRADGALQGLGRTHRTNQKQPPEYVLVSTDSKSQKRFISSIARRLEQLGALTKGQRQASGGGLFDAADNLESEYANLALKGLVKDVVNGKIDTLPKEDFESQMGMKLTKEKKGGGVEIVVPTITQFLNRLLSLNLDMQDRVFGAFESRMQGHIQQAQEMGTLDTGLEMLHGDKIQKVRETTIHKDPRTGSETKHIQVKRFWKTNPIDLPERPGMVYRQNTRSGAVYAYEPGAGSVTDSEGVVHRMWKRFSVLGPQGNVKEADVSKDTLRTLTADQARGLWADQRAKAPTHQSEDLHLLSGTLLPIWHEIPNKFSKVFRVKLEDGNSFLGRRLDEESLGQVLDKFGVDANAGLKPKDAFDVLDKGGTVTLKNGWRIIPAKVAGETRYEVIGKRPGEIDNYAREFTKMGMIREERGWKARTFIPTGETGEKVFENFAKAYPIRKLEDSSGDAVRYSLKQAGAARVTRADVEQTFPGTRVEDLGKRGWRVNFWTGQHIDVRVVKKVKVDWEAAERTYGRKFSVAERSAIAASGSFEMKTGEGRKMNGIGLLQLAAGLADSGTVRHESVHFAREMGLFTNDEWAALVKEHSRPDASDSRQEEDVAEARALWKGPGTFLKKMRGWAQKLLGALGVTSGLTAEEVHRTMDTAEFWTRMPDIKDGTQSVHLVFGRPELANPATHPEARALVDQVDQNRKEAGEPQFRSDDEVVTQARAMLDQNYEATKRTLLKVARSGGQLSDAETLAAKQIVDREAMQALRSDDPARIADAMHLVDAYRRTGTEQARAFRQRRDPLETPEQRMQRALAEAMLTPPKRYSLEQWKTKVLTLKNELKVLGSDLDNMEKVSKDPIAAARTLKTIAAAKRDMWDAAYEYWINGILSALPTHITNMTSNFSHGMYHYFAERVLQSVLGTVLRDRNAPQLGEYPYLIAGVLPGLSRGMKNLLMTWRTEIPWFEHELGLSKQTALESNDVAISGIKGRVIRAPQRALMACDEMFKTLWSTMEVGAQAYRIAKAEGLEGIELQRSIAEQVQDIESDAWTKAILQAKHLTFQDAPDRFARAAIQVRGAFPGLRYQFPFITTPWNIVKTGLKKSPAGTLELGYHLGKAFMSGNYEGVTERMATQMLAWGGVLVLLGNNPDDPWITGSSRRFSDAGGIPPQSIKIGDRWYSYSRIEPFATMLGVTVDGVNAAKRPAGSGQFLEDLKKTFVGQISTKTFLQGLGDLVTTVESKDPDKWMKFATNFTVSWVPNIVRSTGRAFQDTIPERDIWGSKEPDYYTRVMERLLQKTELGIIPDQPKYDLWGRTIDRSESPVPKTDWAYRLFVPFNNELDRRTVGDRLLLAWNNANPDKEKNPQPPGKDYVDPKTKETKYLTDEQYAEYTRESGRAAATTVQGFKWDAEHPTEEQIKDLTHILAKTRKAVRDQLELEWTGQGKADLNQDHIVAEVRADMIAQRMNDIGERRPVTLTAKEKESGLTIQAKIAKWQSDLDASKAWFISRGVSLDEAKAAYLEHLRQRGIQPGTRGQDARRAEARMQPAGATE